MRVRLFHILRLAGSHGATLALLGITAAVVAAGLHPAVEAADWVAVPLAGLFVNLIAALVAQGSLRAQPMLYAFHALLAVLVVLIGADRLTALRGHVEVTEGALFDPDLAVVEAGPLHPWALDRVAFRQDGFEINYLPGMKRRETVSRVYVPATQGNGWDMVEVGDDDPLIVGNYRFYTSFNKGFAPIVTYTGRDGSSVSGAVHMPSYPLRDFEQGNAFAPPGGPELKLWLSIPQPVYDPETRWVFRVPDDARLVVIDGGVRHELAKGEAVPLAGGGSLRFAELRVWMGYTIAANLLTPWIMAVALAACLALGLHLVGRLMPRPLRRTSGSEVRHAG